MLEKIDQLIDSVESLPPSPTIMIELVKLLKKPDRDIDEMVQLMSHDPSLTAEILRRCNSAVFGGDQPATDIFEATFRLGFYEVYRIAMALSGSRTLEWPEAGRGVRLHTLWEHSALTAISASLLAKQLQEGEGIAFTAGLLHDIGKVVLACVDTETYRDLSHSAPTEESLAESEVQQFGFDHGQVGARLLSRWGLPKEIVGPVEYHHWPQKAANSERLAAILHLADSGAYDANGHIAQVHRNPAGEFSLSVLKLDTEKFTSLMGEIREDTGKVKNLFGI